MANTNLHNSRRDKFVEFYTRLEDIENELYHYTEHFVGKTVFCNCDDPYESNFFYYFATRLRTRGGTFPNHIITRQKDTPIIM